MQGTAMVFTPATAFATSSRVTLQVIGGPVGVTSPSGALLTESVTEHFTIGRYSQARLSQVLAELGYLPMTWSEMASGAARAESSGANEASSTPQGQAFSPPAGTVQWKPGYPATLRGLSAPTQ